MKEKCGNCHGTGNVTFNIGVIGHATVRCATCHGTGQYKSSPKHEVVVA